MTAIPIFFIKKQAFMFWATPFLIWYEKVRDVYKRQVVGVSEGYKKELELVGVGYRASNQGNIIELALGCLLYTSRCV